MIETKRMMETDKDTGVKRQVMPITHFSAVLGLDDFLKGNLFQPEFERVMAQLLEHYDRVSENIDSKAKEIEEHADQKIAEFDEKVAGTEAAIKVVEKDLAETKEVFDSLDVFNKQESSANVINQIGGTETTILKKEFIPDGLEVIGSRENNESFDQSDYDNLLDQNGYVRNESMVIEHGAEIKIEVKMIETLVAKYPYLFSGLSTMDEKKERYLSVVKNVEFSQISRGGGIKYQTSDSYNYSRPYIKVVNGSGTFWAIASYGNTGNTFVKSGSTFNDSVKKQLDENGCYTFFVSSRKNGFTDNGAVSDGVTPAWVELKDIRLIIEFEASAKEIIDSRIAAYCGGLNEISFEKVGEV